MEKKYAWAQNETKLERAIGELGPEASEEEVKARYIEMAGFVLTDAGELPADVVLKDEGIDAKELLKEIKKSKKK